MDRIQKIIEPEAVLVMQRIPVPINDSPGLFLHLLATALDSEFQLEKALPKLAGRSSDSRLRGLLEDYLDELDLQIARLQQVFRLGEDEVASGESISVLGIVDEAEEILLEISNPALLDVAILAFNQEIGSHKIARYTTLCRWIRQLEYPQSAVQLLDDALATEEGMIERLAGNSERLAENKVILQRVVT